MFSCIENSVKLIYVSGLSSFFSCVLLSNFVHLVKPFIRWWCGTSLLFFFFFFCFSSAVAQLGLIETFFFFWFLCLLVPFSDSFFERRIVIAKKRGEGGYQIFKKTAVSWEGGERPKNPPSSFPHISLFFFFFSLLPTKTKTKIEL